MNQGSRIFNVVLIAASLLTAVCSLAQAPAGLPQFSGDISVNNPKLNKSLTGKMYSSGTKIRMDMTLQGQTASTILDLKTQVTDVLVHAQKLYLETTLPTAAPGMAIPKMEAYDPDNPCANMKDTTCKKAGTETLNGRTCDKWIFTQSDSQQTVWLDQKLHMPIKAVQADGATFEMTNIQEGAPSASLFEIPADYHKLDASALGGMLGNQGNQK